LTSHGKECVVPSVCFVIPAPDMETKDYMTRYCSFCLTFQDGILKNILYEIEINDYVI
jgi:hypothetical protein